MVTEDLAFSQYAGFHPKQTLALQRMYEQPEIQLLCGGAGFGGKSRFLRAAAIHHQTWLAAKGFYLPSVFASESYESLRDRHFAHFQQEWGEWGHIKKDDKEYGRCFRFYNHSIPPLCLRNLSNVDERRGSEYAAGFLDEVTEILEAVYGDFLYTIRAPGPECHPVVCATNPDGIGHYWVKDKWRPHMNDEQRRSPFPSRVDPMGILNPSNFAYVPFLPDDNPQFDEERFWRAVSSQPEHIQKARRWGLWDAPEGARWPFLNPDAHLFNFKKTFPNGIPNHWPIILCIDYGLRAPYCCLWVAFDHDGNAWCFREDYQAGLTADAQAQRVAEKTPGNERIKGIYLDPAMWQRLPGHQGPSEITTQQMYADVLCKMVNFPKSLTPGWNKSRVHALSTLDKFLNRNNPYPNLYISEDCQALWGELCGAIFKKGAGLREFSEDLDERCADHAITALYYGLHTYTLKAAPVDPSDYGANLEHYQKELQAKREKEALADFKKEFKPKRLRL